MFLASLYAYPWDLNDEGLDRSLGRIADTGCQEVMVAVSYHISTYFLPHNPVRSLYHGEDGAIYFTPDAGRYGKTRIRPRVSEVVTGPGYLERIVEAIEKKHLKFGAWIVYLFNHHLSWKYKEFAKHDALGNAYHGQLSPWPEDVGEYALALTGEILDRFKPAAVHVESLSRLRWSYGFLNPKVLSAISPRDEFLLGLCFNPASAARVTAAGLDAAKFQRDVAAWLRPRLARLPKPEDLAPVTKEWIDEALEGRLAKYLAVSRAHTTAMWTRVAERIRRSGARLQTVPASVEGSWRDDLGPEVGRNIDRVTIAPLRPDDGPAGRVRELSGRIAKNGIVMISTQPGGMTNPGPLQEQVHTAAAAGAGGATFYNYGLLREEQLGFIRTALATL